MHEKKIYLSVKDWWKDKKEKINGDLTKAQEHVTDPEIVKIMQELLKNSKINTEITEYFKISGGNQNHDGNDVS